MQGKLKCSASSTRGALLYHIVNQLIHLGFNARTHSVNPAVVMKFGAHRGLWDGVQVSKWRQQYKPTMP